MDLTNPVFFICLQYGKKRGKMTQKVKQNNLSNYITDFNFPFRRHTATQVFCLYYSLNVKKMEFMSLKRKTAFGISFRRLNKIRNNVFCINLPFKSSHFRRLGV